jgi:hypothetical protein
LFPQNRHRKQRKLSLKPREWGVLHRALGAEDDGFVSYGKFRNFLVLLPDAKLTEVDPSIAWFEAATMVPFGPPAQKDKSGKLLVRAALAGGIASGTTTMMMCAPLRGILSYTYITPVVCPADALPRALPRGQKKKSSLQGFKMCVLEYRE